VRHDYTEAFTKGMAAFERAVSSSREFSGDVRVENGVPVIPLTALRIVDRHGQDVHLHPNKVQRAFLEKVGVGEDWELPRGSTHVVLKERQTGITTITAGLLFLDTITHKNRRTAIITHREETSREIFRIYERFYKNLLKDYPFLAPYLEAESSTRQELVFGQLGGWVKVAWCRQQDPFSGETVHNIHWSEPAKYEADVEALRNSVLGATDPGFLVEIIESTARGRGNWFHDEYQKAVDGIGNRVAHFYPWPFSEKNVLPLADGEPLPDVPHIHEPGWMEYEREVVEKHDIPPEGIKWWRITKDRLGQFFEQEYPLTDAEAFIAAEMSYIPKEVIAWVANCIEPPIRIEKHAGCDLRIWAEYDARESYVVGVDTATGEANEANDPDYSALTVLSREGVVVATWKGRVGINDFGDVVERVARKYGYALIVPERNAIGLALIQYLRADLAYTNIFTQRRKDKRTGGGARPQYGFEQTRASKRLLIDTLIRGLLDKDVTVMDDLLLNELTTFEDKDGKLGARVGHDDLLIALALAYYGALYYPRAERKGVQSYTHQKEQDNFWTEFPGPGKGRGHYPVD